MSIIIAIIAITLIIFYVWYIKIITNKNSVKETLSGIDVQLKKRTDLIPNILKIAAKFMEHEKSLLEEITQLRTQILKQADKTDDKSVEKRFELENILEDKLSGLMVSVENYPDLKSQETMLEAQRAYADVEQHISAARRSYNSALTDLRNSIEIFPGNIVAKIINVTAGQYFETTEAERKPVDANDFL